MDEEGGRQQPVALEQPPEEEWSGLLDERERLGGGWLTPTYVSDELYRTEYCKVCCP